MKDTELKVAQADEKYKAGLCGLLILSFGSDLVGRIAVAVGGNVGGLLNHYIVPACFAIGAMLFFGCAIYLMLHYRKEFAATYPGLLRSSFIFFLVYVLHYRLKKICDGKGVV